MSYKKQKLLTLHERLGSSPVRVANHFRFRCLVFVVVVNLRYVPNVACCSELSILEYPVVLL